MSTYIDHIRGLRGDLLEIETHLRDPYVRPALELVVNARMSLGLVLDILELPDRNYVRAHNIRKLHGENFRVPQADVKEWMEDWPIQPEASLEFTRQRLTEVARLIYTRLCISAWELDINFGVDFVSRAWQDTLLARCHVSTALSHMAFLPLPANEAA